MIRWLEIPMWLRKLIITIVVMIASYIIAFIIMVGGFELVFHSVGGYSVLLEESRFDVVSTTLVFCSFPALILVYGYYASLSKSAKRRAEEAERQAYFEAKRLVAKLKDKYEEEK